MSDNITNAFKNTYHNAILHLAQQKQSVLRPAVRNYMFSGEYYDVDILSDTATTLVSASHQETTNTDMTINRRRLSLQRYTHAPLIDNFDKLKMIIDPEADYIMNAVMAMNRTIDDVIVDAFTDAATTGKTGSGSSAFDSNNVISAASSGLGVDKLRQAKRILDLNDVDPDIPRFIAVSPYQMDDLLGNTKATSADYNTVRALVYGEIDTFLGFKFLVSNRLNKSSSTRHCIAWAYDGMALGVGKDMQTSIDKRPDLNNDWQVFTEMFIGATRLMEEKVVRVDCTES